MTPTGGENTTCDRAVPPPVGESTTCDGAVPPPSGESTTSEVSGGGETRSPVVSGCLQPVL